MFGLYYIDFAQEYFKFIENIDEKQNESAEIKRKDYCYDCNNDDLYCHAMTFKCSKCHKIILGG